jgi:HAD superfamily hydrolase (TIGR01549 family)
VKNADIPLGRMHLLIGVHPVKKLALLLMQPVIRLIAEGLGMLIRNWFQGEKAVQRTNNNRLGAEWRSTGQNVLQNDIYVKEDYRAERDNSEMEGNVMLENKDIRAIIFDIDGTLVDTFEVYQKVFNRGIAQFGVEPTTQEVLRDYLAKGLSLRQILDNVFPCPIDDDTFATCRTDILELFKKAEIGEVKAFPGTEELFGHLQQKGIKIGIATGRMSSNEDEWARFRKLGLDGYISAIVTSKEIQFRKPAPDVIIECAKRLDVPAETCIAIGDTVSDIHAAKQAGSLAAAVTTGHEDEDNLLKEGPDFLFHSVGDLALYLKQNLSDPQS